MWIWRNRLNNLDKRYINLDWNVIVVVAACERCNRPKVCGGQNTELNVFKGDSPSLNRKEVTRKRVRDLF